MRLVAASLTPFSLTAICSVLGHDADVQAHNYSQYVDNYRHRQFKPVGTGTAARSAQCKLVSVSLPCGWLIIIANGVSGHGPGKDRPDSGSIGVLLAAAQQCDYLPPEPVTTIVSDETDRFCDFRNSDWEFLDGYADYINDSWGNLPSLA